MTEREDFSVRDLVVKIVIPKLDAIQSDLAEKADRSRVHDLITRLAAFELLVSKQLAEKADSARVSALETWRNRLGGALAVVAFFASVNGLRLWLWF